MTGLPTLTASLHAHNLPVSMRSLSAALILCTLTLVGCHRSEAPTIGPKIGSTTSYLEAALRDLLGQNLALVRLSEPGTCPGHFDIRPSQAVELRQCQALLRFDFQKSLDAKLGGHSTNQPHIAEVVLHGGMCQPENYLSACRQLAEHFVDLKLLSRSNANTRLSAITHRIEALSRDATNQVAQAGLLGAPVIASAHQRDFCACLGLKVVATFRAADTASIAEIEEAIDAGKLNQIRLVIANLPEGRRTADALAERLKARVVVFENFPALRHGSVSFDEMFLANLAVLSRTAAP